MASELYARLSAVHHSKRMTPASAHSLMAATPPDHVQNTADHQEHRGEDRASHGQTCLAHFLGSPGITVGDGPARAARSGRISPTLQPLFLERPIAGNGGGFIEQEWELVL